jgi:hypothetical protein
MITGTSGARAWVLVRDADGRPKFDNIHGIPPEIWRMLIDDEQREVSSHGGYPSDDSHP